MKIERNTAYDTYFANVEELKANLDAGRSAMAEGRYDEAHSAFATSLNDARGEKIQPEMVMSFMLSGVMALLTRGDIDGVERFIDCTLAAFEDVENAQLQAAATYFKKLTREAQASPV